MNPFEKNCPFPSTHEKCVEARYFLVQCFFNYHAPLSFLHNLNAFIQAFRNITFMLQNEECRPSEFKSWYEMKRVEMRNLPTLRCLVEARNIVVKQSSLTAKSSVVCGLFRGRRMKLSMKKEIKPFTDTQTILDLTAKFVGKMFLGGKHDAVGEQAGVERHWVVDEIGEGEVLALCVDALNYMISLVDEAHQLLGTSSELESFGIADMREFSVLLESDADPTLPEKWGWI